MKEMTSGDADGDLPLDISAQGFACFMTLNAEKNCRQ
jgi:hypothetical protein